MTLSLICECHVVLLAALLLVAGAAKLAGARRRPAEEDAGVESASMFGPAMLMSLDGRVPMAALATMEISLGVALLATPSVVFRAITIVVFATATWVIVELRSRRPGVGCGCFGPLSQAPACTRSLVRAALLTAAAASVVGVPVSGVEVLGELSAAQGVGLAVELALIAFISPELHTALDRLRHRVPCEVRERPVTATLRRLRGSRAWRKHAALLVGSEPVDIWRELCWRYVVYRGRANGRVVDVVFAVYLKGLRPPVWVAVVDAEPPRPSPPGDGRGRRTVAISSAI